MLTDLRISHIPFVDLKAQVKALGPQINAAMSRVIQNTTFILGEDVSRFEEAFATYCEARYAIGVGSGTAAMEVALRAFDIGPGDEVIMAANTSNAAALAVTTPQQRKALYTDDFAKSLDGYRGEQPLVDCMRSAPARTGLDRAQYADLKFWLPGDILTKVDRTSMSVGLEAREPLLDHRLVEFCAKVPERARIRGSQGKWLLKNTMERYLPDDSLYRQKQGFVTPISEWFRGPLAAQAKALADNSLAVRMGWLERDNIRTLTQNHLAGRSDNGRILWQLTMLDRALENLKIAA